MSITNSLILYTSRTFTTETATLGAEDWFLEEVGKMEMCLAKAEERILLNHRSAIHTWLVLACKVHIVCVKRTNVFRTRLKLTFGVCLIQSQVTKNKSKQCKLHHVQVDVSTDASLELPGV